MMRRVAAVLVAVAALGVAAAPAAAFVRHPIAWRFRWPSRIGFYHHTFFIPASVAPVEVAIDREMIQPDGWNTLACGSSISSNDVDAIVYYAATYTRVELYARSGWFCYFPSVGDWSTVTFFFATPY